MDDNETREDRVRRYAQNRYDMRIRYKFCLNDTDKDDWKCAEEQVRREEIKNASDDPLRDGGY